ncbi:MAG: PspC domain-containing protein [Burkholderiaceae bacterium]
MSIADDIDRLAAQHDAGRITDAEFEAAKAHLFAQRESASAPAGASTSSANYDPAINTLRRSLNDRWVGGVCGGLAKFTGVESWVIRLLFVIAILFGGFGFIPYILLWIFVPPEGAR